MLIGPTAVGKSNLLYSHFKDAPLHVISADSMQVYRHFDLATATPNPDELETFPHTGINEIDPSESFSVSDFLEMADRGCIEARNTGRHPLVIGGTPLYLRVFLYGLDEMPDKNPDFRQQMRKKARNDSLESLHERLREIDPESARKIHPNDTRRVIRALEIYHESGRTKTELTSKDRIRPHVDPFIVRLRRSRDDLRRRIRKRVDAMLKNGLIKEVHSLRERWDVSRTLKQAIGFRSVANYLDNKLERDRIDEKIVDRTVELARKQESWFKKFPVNETYHPTQDKEELIEVLGNQFS